MKPKCQKCKQKEPIAILNMLSLCGQCYYQEKYKGLKTYEPRKTKTNAEKREYLKNWMRDYRNSFDKSFERSGNEV